MGAALLLVAEAVSARCAYAGLVAFEPILGLAAQGVWGECALDSPLEGTRFENGGPASRAMPVSTGDTKAGLNCRSSSGWSGPEKG
jgi:hypothetical protein